MSFKSFNSFILNNTEAILTDPVAGTDQRKIKAALISVFHKDGLGEIAELLHKQGVKLYSTGGTQKFLEDQNIPVYAVEDITSYPSILGGRVKTLHPKVFGGILGRRNLQSDLEQLSEYEIPEIDLVVVDLYPFEDTVAETDDESKIIEKIDIGGISLIRAAAKNYRDVLVCASRNNYSALRSIAEAGSSTLEQRKEMAKTAFAVSSTYDTAIHQWFSEGHSFSAKVDGAKSLRYGENPHQSATFYGDLDAALEQLHGKAISYNNLVDIDSAVNLMSDFQHGDPAFAILKHTNSCGLAVRESLLEAYTAALACDPISAFGGILIANRTIDLATAEKIHELFCEVVIAPDFEEAALNILKGKKNRIILRQKPFDFGNTQYRNLLNGVIVQDKDNKAEQIGDFTTVTEKQASEREMQDLIFANLAVKHLKSNGIALVKNRQLVGMGVGQTSRVDALKQAIIKAKAFGFDLEGAVMGSDAFFPFPDCVEIAHKAGITAVTQPGGSIRDKDSINYCNTNGLAMVTTGIRHFKH